MQSNLPISHFAKLNGGGSVELANNLRCPCCGQRQRLCDVESLQPGAQITCRDCGTLIIKVRP